MSRAGTASVARLRSELGKARRAVRSYDRSLRLVTEVAVSASRAHQASAAGVCTTEVHEQKKLDPAWWASLPLVGHMFDLELRNCTCGSTLAIAIDSVQS